MRLSLAGRMLLGRFLTRSGDQAWDFAVPLVLLKVLPGQLRIAALYFLLVRLAHVIFLPYLASFIDRVNRLRTSQIGIVLQLAGVLGGTVSIYGLMIVNSTEPFWGPALPVLVFLALVLSGIMSSLGSSFMDIAIANDLVPSSLDQESLTSFNSRLRQVDLFTEVSAPVAAGLLLLYESPVVSLAGFLLVAMWNVLSFFPEYGLLSSVFRERPDLQHKEIVVSESIRIPFFSKIARGWRAFFSEPVAMAVLAYAILWLSVLSPHGVLLTAFLIDGWALPEWAIGTFRGLGACFGLLATVLFPMITERLGLVKGSRVFILFQAVMVACALIFFLSGGIMGQVGFLACILLSRIGLYGFSQGEMQIRQVGIAPSVRGEVNGFASALTGIATLGLYGAGALLPSTADFRFLVAGSVAMVVLGAVIFFVWSSGEERSTGKTGRSDQ